METITDSLKVRERKMEGRYKELWKQGLRSNVIFRKLADEYKLSFHTVQKMLDVRKLKKELTD